MTHNRLKAQLMVGQYAYCPHVHQIAQSQKQQQQQQQKNGSLTCRMISNAAWEAAPALTQMADANMTMPAGKTHDRS